MIARLSGSLLEVNPPHVVLDVNGVGYEVEVPTSVLDSLPARGEALTLDPPGPAVGQEAPRSAQRHASSHRALKVRHLGGAETGS